mmetsp:Transcript_21544/g.56159  ORF Transcript_21544/g.56159 Transcript_21544/m.56159 type:complete len:497 (+) Transcript_21544:291-1781(+)
MGPLTLHRSRAVGAFLAVTGQPSILRNTAVNDWQCSNAKPETTVSPLRAPRGTHRTSTTSCVSAVGVSVLGPTLVTASVSPASSKRSIGPVRLVMVAAPSSPSWLSSSSSSSSVVQESPSARATPPSPMPPEGPTDGGLAIEEVGGADAAPAAGSAHRKPASSQASTSSESDSSRSSPKTIVSRSAPASASAVAAPWSSSVDNSPARLSAVTSFGSYRRTMSARSPVPNSRRATKTWSPTRSRTRRRPCLRAPRSLPMRSRPSQHRSRKVAPPSARVTIAYACMLSAAPPESLAMSCIPDGSAVASQAAWSSAALVAWWPLPLLLAPPWRDVFPPLLVGAASPPPPFPPTRKWVAARGAAATAAVWAPAGLTERSACPKGARSLAAVARAASQAAMNRTKAKPRQSESSRRSRGRLSRAIRPKRPKKRRSPGNVVSGGRLSTKISVDSGDSAPEGSRDESHGRAFGARAGGLSDVAPARRRRPGGTYGREGRLFII